MAQRWLEDYDKDNTTGLCELVNFVLKCTGCDLKVDNHDIDDPDNAPNKLTDLQEEYQSQNITDYPLIQKSKGSSFSRRQLESFFHDLIDTLHKSGTLYNDLPLYANIENWIVPLTSSPIRPFRHTSTVITLALISAFCEVMKDIDRNIGMTTRAKQQEEKGKKKAKDKIASYQAKITELEGHKEEVDKWIHELFDSTFVHKYRDIDPRIRADCAVALGSWIEICPDIFFDGQFLRYLGWLLSDQNHTVRHQVLAQFLRLYNKDDPDVGRLRAFTQRFRDRMVEIATRDSEVNIRVMAVDLLDSIRTIGLLEAEHIDAIGRLVFDVEAKVRKAVAPFFAANVEDAFENITEALGGAEGLEEALGEESVDDYDVPHSFWLKYKSIAQLLDEYDAEDEESGNVQYWNLLPSWSSVPSRYTIAAEVVYEGIEEVNERWPMLAGYLLYDVTTKQSAKKRKSQDPLELFKQRCNLTDKQERLLLEVLVVATRLCQAASIEAHTDKRSKNSKARAEEVEKAGEGARNVVTFLPRLLGKFGANPESAAIVLRMARYVSYNDIPEDSVEYETLLDDIGKQFLTHHDKNVLEEAISALLYACKHEELEEATLSKIQDLWEKVSANLHQSTRAKAPQLNMIADSVLKISKLTDISDPTGAFLRVPSKTKAREDPISLLELLIGLIETYTMTESSEAEAIVVGAAMAISKFYMWTVTSIQSKLAESSDEVPATAPHRQQFSSALVSFIEERPKADKARLAAISILLDTYTAFATLRKVHNTNGTTNGTEELITEISPEGQNAILRTFVTLENKFAKKSGKSLEDDMNEAVDEAPESDSEEDDEEEELDTEEQTQRDQQRNHEKLLLERAFCELSGKIVLALLARVLDASGSNKGVFRKRILKNKTKLGPNFKEVLAYIDGPKSKKQLKSKSKGVAAETAPAVQEVPAAEVTPAPPEEEDDEDEIEEVEEGDEEDLRRRELLTDLPEDEIEDDGADEDVANDNDDDDDIMGD